MLSACVSTVTSSASKLPLSNTHTPSRTNTHHLSLTHTYPLSLARAHTHTLAHTPSHGMGNVSVKLAAELSVPRAPTSFQVLLDATQVHALRKLLQRNRRRSRCIHNTDGPHITITLRSAAAPPEHAAPRSQHRLCAVGCLPAASSRYPRPATAQ